MIRTSELEICKKLPGDLEMSEKMKKHVVSTHDQCLAHHIFLEICIPKSFVVWPVQTASHLSQHACKILHNLVAKVCPWGRLWPRLPGLCGLHFMEAQLQAFRVPALLTVHHVRFQ